MTKGELWKGVTLRLITALAFGVIGYLALDRALAMVGIFGEGLGVDERSRQIYADSHQIVHVFGAACSLAIGVFLLTGHKTLRWIAVVALLSAGSYGIFNMIGFTSVNRVSVAAAKDADKSAAERDYLTQKKALEDTIRWAQATAQHEDGRERRRLLSYVDEKRKELAALKAPRPDASKVLSDPQATTLAALTQSDERRWQLALPIPLAVLIFFAEAFSFVVVGHMLAGIVGVIVAYRTSEPGEPRRGSSGSSGSGGRLKVVQPSEPAKQVQGIKAGSARTMHTQLPKVSSGHRGVFSTDAPTGKLTYEQFVDHIANDMAHGEPASSTRALAARTGWSQSSVVRHRSKVMGKARTNMRRYAGNGGGGYHAPAMG